MSLQSSSSSQNNAKDHDDNEPSSLPKSATTASNNNHHHNTNSIIGTIENHSILVYSVLFSIIGLRLDAAQLAETLIAHPLVSLLLFCGRFTGLCVGGYVGSLLGGRKKSAKLFVKWRGPSLVTRIAVSIILLQKMEDVLVGSKAVVHAAIGAVLIDMCVGPALLQWSLKKVVEESQIDARRRVMNGEEEDIDDGESDNENGTV